VLLSSYKTFLQATRELGFRASASFKHKFLILELVSCGFWVFSFGFLQYRSLINLPNLNVTALGLGSLDLDLCFNAK
jgi:hypothetical protein